MSIGNIVKLNSADLEQFREHLLRLDKDSRRTRFAHSVSDSFIEKYAALTAEIETVMHGCFVDGVLRGVSELRPMGDGWGDKAEAAFSVETELQDQGIATELMGRIIGSARNRNVSYLYVSCLAENRKMQRIAKKFEAQLKFEYGEVIGKILPQHSLTGSIAEKVLGDEISYLKTVLYLDGSGSKADGGKKVA